MSGLVTVLRRSRFGIAALLIPLGIRAIPEIIVGPYPIGWDTIAFYVPNTLDWAAGKAGPLEMLGTAPLMYMISVPTYLLLRVNPVWIFKIMGPALYGSMIYSLYRLLKNSSHWPETQALGGALLTALYFVTLRISWDMYRNMLGLTFILLSIPLLENFKGPKGRAMLTALIVLAVASDQLTGVLALALTGARALSALTKTRRDDFKGLIKVMTPGATLFFSIVYTGQIVTGAGLVQQQPMLPSLDILGSSIGFLGYAYLALVPVILFGVGKVHSPDVRTWAVFCVGAVLTALLPFFGVIVAGYRWALLLDLPACVYATAGLSRIAGSIHLRVGWTARVQKWIVPFAYTLLVISAILYVALPAQRAMMYYTSFPALLPTSMIQDTVPQSDMGNLKQLLDWAAIKMGPRTALITHQAIYGWARAYLPSSKDYLVNYGYSSPLKGVGLAKSAGYSSVLLIWWVNGSGWHDQPTVPSGFVTVSTDGAMALYTFEFSLQISLTGQPEQLVR